MLLTHRSSQTSLDGWKCEITQNESFQSNMAPIALLYAGNSGLNEKVFYEFGSENNLKFRQSFALLKWRPCPSADPK